MRKARQAEVGPAVTEVPEAVKISTTVTKASPQICDFSEKGQEELLLRFATDTLADQVDEATLRSFAELIVMACLLTDDKMSTVVAAVEPFCGGSGLPITAIKTDSGAHLDKRPTLRQLGRLFELYAHQCCSLVILENPHGAHRNLVAGSGLPDRAPVSSSQQEAHCKYRRENHCSYKKGLFQSLLSQARLFAPYFAASDAFCQSAFQTGSVLWVGVSLPKGNCEEAAKESENGQLRLGRMVWLRRYD